LPGRERQGQQRQRAEGAADEGEVDGAQPGQGQLDPEEARAPQQASTTMRVKAPRPPFTGATVPKMICQDK
jgi:hypothetical protein